MNTKNIMGFKQVVLADIKVKNHKQEIITDLTKFKENVEKIKYPCEMVAFDGQQVKPYFEVDKEVDPDDYDYDYEVDILEKKIILQDLFKLDSIDDIYVTDRDPREKGDKIKYSYHITIDKIRMSYYNIKKMLEENKIDCFDLSVYDKNRGMSCIGNTLKPSSKKGVPDEVVPPFKPVGKCKDISKFCISYIEEDFQDFDLKFRKREKQVKKDEPLKDILRTNTCEDYELVKSLVNCLSVERADEYSRWLNVGFCLYNISSDILELWDEFSQKSLKYETGKCQELWDKMTKKNITIGTLKYWAKMDNLEEYNNVINNSITNYIDMALGSDGSHYDIAVVVSLISKDKIVYDSSVKSWFVINKYNVWEEDKEGLFFNSLCSVDVCKLFLKRCMNFNENSDDPILNSINQEKCKKCLKIATQLKNSSFVSSVLNPYKSLMAQNDFLENKLDSNTDIFCFNDCLYDLNTSQIRGIEPEDYVFTTTGYDYNANPDENIKKKIYKFLRDVHLNEELYQYNLDVMSSCLIGRNIYQELYFKTGAGANGKSTEQGLYEQAFGKYALCPNAEVLTKHTKGANETSELHKSKGKRVLFMQEPEAEDKIITSRAKKLSGGDKLCVRGLFCNPIEFNPQFKIIVSLNDMVQFSKVDGGIQRRTRVIEYPFKFVDEPDNEMKKKIDRSLETSFKTDVKYRDACISILMHNWPNIKGLPKLNTPKSVMEESEEYCNESNNVLGFVNEKLEITNNPDDMIMSKVLLSMYNTHARDKITATMFGNRLRDMGIKKIKKGVQKIYYYIGIKEIEENECDDY
jgi:P4 family phage/plasmid primase-like protien